MPGVDSQIAEIRALGGKILRESSRTAQFTLRMVPTQLQDAARIGFLLSQLTKYIATPWQAGLTSRKSLLVRLRGFVHTDRPSGQEVELFASEVLRDIGPHVKEPNGQLLLQSIPALILWLVNVEKKQRGCLTKALDAVNRGWSDFMQQFAAEEPEELQFYSEPEDLLRHCSLLGGSLGMAWTELGDVTFSNFSNSNFSSLAESSEEYGGGFLLLGIIQDLGAELKAMRCPIPQKELEEAGWYDGTWHANQGSIMVAAGQWLNQAEHWLRQGMKLTDKITNRRMKIATGLPGLIAGATLQAVRKSQSSFLTRRIEIGQSETRRIFLKTTHRVFFGQPLEPYFDDLVQSRLPNVKMPDAFIEPHVR